MLRFAAVFLCAWSIQAAPQFFPGPLPFAELLSNPQFASLFQMPGLGQQQQGGFVPAQLQLQGNNGIVPPQLQQQQQPFGARPFQRPQTFPAFPSQFPFRPQPFPARPPPGQQQPQVSQPGPTPSDQEQAASTPQETVTEPSQDAEVNDVAPETRSRPQYTGSGVVPGVPSTGIKGPSASGVGAGEQAQTASTTTTPNGKREVAFARRQMQGLPNIPFLSAFSQFLPGQGQGSGLPQVPQQFQVPSGQFQVPSGQFQVPSGQFQQFQPAIPPQAAFGQPTAPVGLPAQGNAGAVPLQG